MCMCVSLGVDGVGRGFGVCGVCVRPKKKTNDGGAGRGDLATQQQRLNGSEVKKQHATESEHRRLGWGCNKNQTLLLLFWKVWG